MQLILGSHRENAAQSKGRNPGSAAHFCWGSTLCAQEPPRCSLDSRQTASAWRSSNFQQLRQHAVSHLLAFAQNVPSGFFFPPYLPISILPHLHGQCVPLPRPLLQEDWASHPFLGAPIEPTAD